MIKNISEIYKPIVMSDSFLRSFVNALFPKNYEKQIAENTAKLASLLKERNK